MQITRKSDQSVLNRNLVHRSRVALEADDLDPVRRPPDPRGAVLPPGHHVGAVRADRERVHEVAVACQLKGSISNRRL